MTLILNADTLEYDFYKAYEDRTHKITVKTPISEDIPNKIATLRKNSTEESEKLLSKMTLERIITSPKSANSDRIYIYTENSNN